MIKDLFECPECESKVEFYNTASDEKSGRYRCSNCGRNTTWAIGKAISGLDLMRLMKEKIQELKKEK